MIKILKERKTLIFKYTTLLFVLTINFNNNLLAQENKNLFYLGLSTAPSFPVSDFAEDFTSSYGISNMLLDFGFKFRNNIGVSGTYISQDYKINQIGTNERLSFSCITLGPMYSILFTEKLALDLKVQFGYISSHLVEDGDFDGSKSGKGFGGESRVLLRYSLFKRWFAVAQFGYMMSKQNFSGNPNIRIQALNIGLGVGIRFGKI